MIYYWNLPIWIATKLLFNIMQVYFFQKMCYVTLFMHFILGSVLCKFDKFFYTLFFRQGRTISYFEKFRCSYFKDWLNLYKMAAISTTCIYGHGRKEQYFIKLAININWFCKRFCKKISIEWNTRRTMSAFNPNLHRFKAATP